MNRGTAMLLGMAVAAVVVCVAVSAFSSATFVSTTTSTATVRAASDWTPPSVTMTSPGSSVQGTITLSASAADAESGVASVQIQYQPVNGTDWVTVCTDATSPYSCSWNTTALPDGQYDVRARATDHTGYTTVSNIVSTVVANNVVVVLASPAEVIRGAVPLASTIHGGLSLTWTVTVEYATAGSGGPWRTACSTSSVLSGSVTCIWATTTVGNGYYDLRTVARATNGTTATSAVVADVLVDNAAPQVTMSDPGSPLRGTVSFAASATEPADESGVAHVLIQYAPSSTGSYQPLCTVTVAPYSCRSDTTRLVDGSYKFRAVATDVAGNSSTSAEVLNRIVDNTVSSVSVEDPGAFLVGTVTVTASASSSAGITSVRIQAAPSGTSIWNDLCTDASAPYSCSWDTPTVPDGLYDLRAVLTDGKNQQTTSAVLAARRVDNSPLRGVDVQASNGTGTPGKLDNGDAFTLTYSRVVTPGSVMPGWNGAAQAVTIRLRDGNVAGLGTDNKGDTIDVRSGTTTSATSHNLGSVNLREDFAKSGKTVHFHATMTASTVTVDGVQRTVVILNVGTISQGTNTSLRTVTVPGSMVWTPSASASSVDGRACSTAPATETGASDRDL